MGPDEFMAALKKLQQAEEIGIRTAFALMSRNHQTEYFMDDGRGYSDVRAYEVPNGPFVQVMYQREIENGNESNTRIG